MGELIFNSRNVSTEKLNSIITRGNYTFSVSKGWFDEAGITGLNAGYGILEVVRPRLESSYVLQRITCIESSSGNKINVIHRLSINNGNTWINYIES